MRSSGTGKGHGTLVKLQHKGMSQCLSLVFSPIPVHPFIQVPLSHPLHQCLSLLLNSLRPYPILLLYDSSYSSTSSFIQPFSSRYSSFLLLFWCTLPLTHSYLPSFSALSSVSTSSSFLLCLLSLLLSLFPSSLSHFCFVISPPRLLL